MFFVRSAKEQIFSHGNMGKQARLLKDVAQRPLMGGNERAAAILPDLSCDIAEPIFNMDQPSDTPQDRRLAASRGAKQHSDPGRRNREHGLKRAAKLGVDLVHRRHAPALARRFWMRINEITTQPRHAAQAGRAPVLMSVPTCAPRSAAVSRPGTSPFTSCTRSMWRAVAMTSSSERSNGNVPSCFARSAALVSR